jgi:hypothetical protein
MLDFGIPHGICPPPSYVAYHLKPLFAQATRPSLFSKHQESDDGLHRMGLERVAEVELFSVAFSARSKMVRKVRCCERCRFKRTFTSGSDTSSARRCQLDRW